MDSHIRVLRELADGRFHSGQTLADGLGISRAAVWKAVTRARERLGLQIDAVTGRGYRLAMPLELLDAGRILGQLSPGVRGRIARLVLHQSIDSTSSWLLRQAPALASGTACLAERQTAGRGRRGRGWVSPFGSNLYLSLLWRFAMPPGDLNGLSLAIGAGVAESLRQAGVEDVALKWPNDLLWQRRKLAGLLLDVVGESTGPSLVVVGLGVNTRMDAVHARHIEQPWVDLASILGPDRCSRNLLAARLLEALVQVLDEFQRAGLEPFLPVWKRYDRFRGERVELRWGTQRLEGIHRGIDRQGSLRLAVDGETRLFRAGEVSLRGKG